MDFTIDAEDPLVAATLGDLLADLAPARGRAAPGCAVTVLGSGPWSVHTAQDAQQADTVEGALTRVLTAVNAAAVTDTPLLALHAAVVSRGGASLVVPARSGSGKSTLAACLLRRGWSYVSDEALALDWRTGALVSYPRPMALSPWSMTAAGGPQGVAAEGETLLRARDLGADVEHVPGPVRHVVLLERSTDPASTDVAEVDRNEGLVELLARGFTHRHDGGRALVLLADLLRGADVVRLRLGDPGAAAAVLTELRDAA